MTAQTLSGDARPDLEDAGEDPEQGPESGAPARRSRHRLLAPILFPIAVFAIWRITASLLTTLAFHRGWLGSGLRWDSGNYLTLVEQGYFQADDFQPVTAFFPFISWVAKALRVVVGHDEWTAIIVANAAALAAFVAVWGAVRTWRGESVARWTVVLVALFPASFFLWSFYSEAAFIAVSAGAVWADRRGHPWIAAVLLVATASTRTIGILVAAVLVLAHLLRDRRIGKAAVLYALGGAAGLGLVMAQMWYQMGDPFAFLSVQEDWGREVVAPWVTVEHGWESIPDSSIFPEQPLTEYKAKILDFVSVWLVLLAALWAAWPRRNPADRWPDEAWMLIIVLAAVPLSSRLLYSFNRFALADWALFAVYAEIIVLSVRRTRLAWLPVAALLVFLAIMSYQFTGHWARYDFMG